MNTVNEKGKEEILILKFVFHNTESKHVTLNDENQHISVSKIDSKKGDFT